MTDTDIYAPPKTSADPRFAIPPSRPVRGVILGALADQIGTLLTSVILAMYLGARHHFAGMAAETIQARIGDLMHAPPLSYFVQFYGCGFSVLGGYVCARYARRREYACALAMAAVDCVWLPFAAGPLTELLGQILLSVLSILAGAFLGRRANERDRAKLS